LLPLKTVFLEAAVSAAKLAIVRLACFVARKGGGWVIKMFDVMKAFLNDGGFLEAKRGRQLRR
jgi:hypothetical protein